MDAAPEPCEIAGLASLYEGAPAEGECLRLFLDPQAGAVPEAMAVLAGLYGVEAVEPGPAISGP
jgi:hypothetical protein